MIENNWYTSVHIKLFLFKQVHEKHLKSGRPPRHLLGHFQTTSNLWFPNNQFRLLWGWQFGSLTKRWRIQKTSTQIQLFELKLLESAVGKNGPLRFWKSVSKAPTENWFKMNSDELEFKWTEEERSNIQLELCQKPVDGYQKGLKLEDI